MSVEVKVYEWRDGMQEISGFGGGYEDACRKMVKQGMEWLDAHPTAEPKFKQYQNITGLIDEENEDAKALSLAVAKGVDPSGAMQQATINACMYIRKNGWDKYCEEMSKKKEGSS